MLKKLADEISVRMVRNKTIDIDDRECYSYGLELLFSKIIFYVVIIIISLLTHAFWVTIFFIVTYMWLRKYSGGYHCKTSEICLLLSIILALINILLYKFSIDFPVDNMRITWLIGSGIAYIIILIFSPIASPNKPITLTEKKKYKIITMLLSTAIMTAIVLSFCFKCNVIFYPSSYAMVIDAALMLLSFL